MSFIHQHSSHTIIIIWKGLPFLQTIHMSFVSMCLYIVQLKKIVFFIWITLWWTKGRWFKAKVFVFISKQSFFPTKWRSRFLEFTFVCRGWSNFHMGLLSHWFKVCLCWWWWWAATCMTFKVCLRWRVKRSNVMVGWNEGNKEGNEVIRGRGKIVF